MSDRSIKAEVATERRRLEAVRRHGPPGKVRGAAYDRVARLAAHLMRAPVAVISLLDADRQWNLARHGIAG